jgi:hypothetical protein
MASTFSFFLVGDGWGVFFFLYSCIFCSGLTQRRCRSRSGSAERATGNGMDKSTLVHN